MALAELRIADDEGHFLPPGQTGELVVRTPIAMKGYYRDEAQTRAAFRDGWFLTGDLAWVEERALSQGPAAFDDLVAGRVAAAKIVLRPGA